MYQLLIVFLQIGIFSIGGGYAVIPLIQNYVVSEYGWLSLTEFTDIITISQMTPGPLAVNTSTFVGLKIGGLAGAVTATFGCIISGCIISVTLCNIFDKYKKVNYIWELLRGLRSVSTGLIASSAVTILIIAFKIPNVSGTESINFPSVIIFTAALAVFKKFKLNPVYVIIAGGAAGYFVF